uniref:Uncharacterized protein n=1 Tax=Caenorhabditis tropicalis TaxID=1561998 RepID=A0A1I7USL8_9PELO
MGRRAKARRRAARQAAQSADLGSEVTSGASDETDCEIPIAPSKPSPSRIPVLQKGYQASKSSRSSPSPSPSASKIPRPRVIVQYLKPIDVEYSDEEADSTHESDDPPSFTCTTGSFIDSEMISAANRATIPEALTPLPLCDLSSEFSTKTGPETDQSQVMVIADANGTELKFDMQAMLEGLDLSLVGLKFL